MSSQDDVLLFDLGGVLVDVAPTEQMIASLGLTPESVEPAKWAAIACWERFETGELDAVRFCEELVAEWSLGIDAARVLNEFRAWNRRMLPGSVETLAELRGRYRLAVLSNTNALHWERLSGEFGIPGLVDRAFASHLIGLRKPDPRVYRHVAQELGVAPKDIVFFDDSAPNVAAARRLGMQAWCVEGVGELRARLKELGYL